MKGSYRDENRNNFTKLKMINEIEELNKKSENSHSLKGNFEHLEGIKKPNL